MKSKAFYLSLEAIVSMALLGLLLAMPLQTGQPSLNNLHVFKKANDLLLLWAREYDSLTEAKLLQDFGFAFPGKAGKIVWNEKTVSVGRQGQESISSQAVFFDRHGQKQKILLVVFK